MQLVTESFFNLVKIYEKWSKIGQKQFKKQQLKIRLWYFKLVAIWFILCPAAIAIIITTVVRLINGGSFNLITFAISYVIAVLLTIIKFAITIFGGAKIRKTEMKEKGFKESDDLSNDEYSNYVKNTIEESLKNSSSLYNYVHGWYLKSAAKIAEDTSKGNRALNYWNDLIVCQFNLFWLSILDFPTDHSEFYNHMIEMNCIPGEYIYKLSQMVATGNIVFNSIDYFTKKYFASERDIDEIIDFAKVQGAKKGEQYITGIYRKYDVVSLFEETLIKILDAFNYEKLILDGKQISFDKEKDDPFEVARDIMKWHLAQGVSDKNHNKGKRTSRASA